MNVLPDVLLSDLRDRLGSSAERELACHQCATALCCEGHLTLRLVP